MYKLFYYPGNASLAPHILLEEIGASYELALVDRAENRQKSPEYLKLNPNGRIPTLVDDDLVLYESAAICLHLADRHAEAGFAPTAGTARAQLYKWLIYLTNTLQPEHMAYFYPERHSADPAHWPAIKARAEDRLGELYDLMEAELAKAGPYLLGAQYSIADIYLFMLGRWGRVLGRPPRARNHLGRYLTRIGERPAVKRTFSQEQIAEPYF